ncbi:LOW QUALITY PROTEIN: Hypothetical protein PHPALM_6067 [Phytophthora palmivora]|uniref:PiggyBac transposable element-derived protein domain-containing protein n=1 Tax=Phytophthora palmivora TaxID=4796 RepID=A0A2P4YFR3_9STRA|nr:LOW QUALITY PROTEIN: Hypothetical protein PHPALM_6067 [Phytophthora palmivora]
MAVKSVLPHDLCVFIGLLLARAIQPNREKISNYWKHNLDPPANADRAWKIRKVVHVLQRTFRRGFVPPVELAFDEAMFSSRSSFNTTRVYMKDKPYKFEVYVRKKQHIDAGKSIDKKSGPAAVVRNLKAAFPEGQDKGFRLVVTDRFYTSVALAIQLLLMGFYTVGTIMTNRIGFAESIKEKKTTWPKDIMRGTLHYVRSTKVKEIAAITWWDSKPVFFLCTGSNLAMDRVVRRDKTGEQHEIPCPKAVKDYHKYMGGVDVHDQLRLQRYSMHRAVTFRKYYKSLFLGLVDLAIVNGFIIHRAYHADDTTIDTCPVPSELHMDLINLKSEDMFVGNKFGAGALPTGTFLTCRFMLVDSPKSTESTGGPATPTLDEEAVGCTQHLPQQVKNGEDTQNSPNESSATVMCAHYFGQMGNAVELRRTIAISVSVHNQCFCCIVDGVRISCWEMWHTTYKSGAAIPEHLQSKIRLRKSPAKRRRSSSDAVSEQENI